MTQGETNRPAFEGEQPTETVEEAIQRLRKALMEYPGTLTLEGAGVTDEDVSSFTPVPRSVLYGP